MNLIHCLLNLIHTFIPAGCSCNMTTHDEYHGEERKKKTPTLDELCGPDFGNAWTDKPPRSQERKRKVPTLDELCDPDLANNLNRKGFKSVVPKKRRYANPPLAVDSSSPLIFTDNFFEQHHRNFYLSKEDSPMILFNFENFVREHIQLIRDTMMTPDGLLVKKTLLAVFRIYLAHTTHRGELTKRADIMRAIKKSNEDREAKENVDTLLWQTMIEPNMPIWESILSAPTYPYVLMTPGKSGMPELFDEEED